MTGFIPSLSMLRAFDAVSRHRSFTKAAAELNQTQAAVSYQIRALEEQLSVRLVSRNSRSVTLTDAGRSFIADVAPSLRNLANAAARVRRRHRPSHALRVLVMQAFASLWLVPRLPRFKVQFPEIEINLLSQMGGAERIPEIDFDATGADVTIVYSSDTTAWRGIFTERLIDDFALPVCSPHILTAGAPVREIADLRHHTLLHAINWQEIWPRWLAHAGMPGLRPSGEFQLQHTAMTVQAALGGMGFAMAHGPLVQEELRTGRLASPLALTLPVREGYYFACREQAAELEPVVTFRAWVRREMDQTV
jgi:LysR family glycine cleavage system transcriptional activator